MALRRSVLRASNNIPSIPCDSTKRRHVVRHTAAALIGEIISAIHQMASKKTIALKNGLHFSQPKEVPVSK
jgi:hypothetical protein